MMGEVREEQASLARGLLTPEGFKERRERGRRSAAILLQLRAALRRPRRLLAVPRVRSHRQRAHRSSPASCRTSRVHDLERLRTEKGAPLPTGVRASCCHRAQPRSPAPESEESYPSRLTPATVRTKASTGSPPPPREAAQLLRPVTGRGVGSVGRSIAAGITHPSSRTPSLARRSGILRPAPHHSSVRRARDDGFEGLLAQRGRRPREVAGG
jgi:hypothetical protein